jgi:hypothetical protein
MPTKTTCECGACKKCKHRAYMHDWYHRKNERWLDRTYLARGSGGMVECVCEWCKRPFQATARKLASHGQTFCSRPCKDKAHQAEAKRVREQSKPERNCLHCGASMPQAMRSDAVFCSEQCNSAAHKLKRGNGRLGPGRRRDIERAYIIERDKSRCHICGEKCRPDEITLDHVIPLSKGGTHAEENLRVAHLSCNARKRDRAANDQLLLIG